MATQVFLDSTKGNSLALKSQLQEQLWRAMGWAGMSMETGNLSDSVELTLERMPLHRLADHRGIFYRSAIAFQLLAAQSNCDSRGRGTEAATRRLGEEITNQPLTPLSPPSAMEIANQLMAALLGMSDADGNRSGWDLGVEVVSPGWINLRLSDRSLAIWLQQLIERGRRPENEPCPTLDTRHQSTPVQAESRYNLFPIQYAHARCCSLLRLAENQGLIELRTKIEDRQGDANPRFTQSNWQIVRPLPIPWLKENLLETEQVRLQLEHPAEQALIAQIVDLLDAGSELELDNWRKRGIALSQGFEQFYRSCRIWGEVKTQTPQLAMARLGLVAVTQTVLRSLLIEHFGIFPLVEL